MSTQSVTSGWNAKIEQNYLLLAPVGSNDTNYEEIRLSVTAPTQEFLNEYTNSTSDEDELNKMKNLELGIVVETNGMAAVITYVTTKIMDESDLDDSNTPKEDRPLDRSMIDPWLVIIILAILLMVGAIARDLIQGRIKQQKSTRKQNVRSREETEDLDDEEISE
jgi:hypothetical protein